MRTRSRRGRYQEPVDQPLHLFRRKLHIYLNGRLAGKARGDIVVYYDPNDPDASREGIVHSATIVSTDGTLEGTRVSGLGGIQVRSRTTTITGQWNTPTTTSVIIRRISDDGGPRAEERARIAQNAVKDTAPTHVKYDRVKPSTSITNRLMIPIPPPPRGTPGDDQ